MCLQMMRPHFSIEKASFSNQAVRAVTLSCEFRHLSVFHCRLTHFSLLYINCLSFFYVFLCTLSHNVILFLVCMSIPLYLSCFCLCLQYLVSHVPTQQVKSQFQQQQIHQLVLLVAELAYLMSRIDLCFVRLSLP